MPEVKEPKMIAVQSLHCNAYNPNEMSKTMFDMLVDEIKSDGFDQPLQVVLCGCDQNPDEHFEIIGGEHRFRAAKQLGMTALPCVIYEWSPVVQKLKTVRRNFLHGALNDKKFTALVHELDGGGYSREDLATLMAFENEGALNRHVLDAKKVEEKDIVEKLLKDNSAVADARDAVADVVNNIMATYGETVDQGYMFFAHKGKVHLLALMDDDLMARVETLVEGLKASGANLNTVLKEKL